MSGAINVKANSGLFLACSFFTYPKPRGFNTCTATVSAQYPSTISQHSELMGNSVHCILSAFRELESGVFNCSQNLKDFRSSKGLCEHL